MGAKRLLPVLLLLRASHLAAQAPCTNTPAYTPCEFVYELSDADAAANPNPYASVRLHVEFRSPRFRTFLLPAYWDGGRRMVVRFTPVEAGDWTYRVTSSIPAFEGKTGNFTTAASEAPGFVRSANVHHWAWTENNRPHLWMGDTCYRFASLDEALFKQLADARARQKFNHLRGLVFTAEDAPKAFPAPDRVNPEYFRSLDSRILYLNGKGIVADLILGDTGNQLARLFPDWRQRERYVRYLAARYSSMNVTWQGVRDFEQYADGRALLKEIGTLLKENDPYQHPRTSATAATSLPLLSDGWMTFGAYQSADNPLGAIEHQLYPVAFVNLEFGAEDSGSGKSGPGDVDTDAFRRRLWNAAMNGQYPTFANTGTMGSKLPVDAKYLDSAGAKQMTVWYEFFEDTRHWELEPYFDVDGGRAVALEDVEYIVYVEKPGPVELLVEKHGYDVAWVNPITGERLKQKNFKGDHFAGEPPDRTHDWILQVSREGHKEGMRSYKFESRQIVLQELETSPAKVPFEVEAPVADLRVGQPVPYGAKIKRETRATRSMMWMWTGDVASGGQGYRVLATGQKGTLAVPPGLAQNYPTSLLLRLYGMNANGKVYAVDRGFGLAQ